MGSEPLGALLQTPWPLPPPCRALRAPKPASPASAPSRLSNNRTAPKKNKVPNSRMNDEDKQRQLTKEQLIQLDRLALIRDNRLKEVDSFPSSYNHSQFYDKFEITVDSEFFDSIVDSVSDKYFSKGSGQVMDDRELDELRESLGIMTYGPGKRNRKRKTFDRLSEDVPIDGDYDGKESSNRGKAFRRVTRNATMKRVQEQQRQVDSERMATLLEAMVEADKLAPLRRRYTAGEKKSMRDPKGLPLKTSCWPFGLVVMLY